MSTDRVRPTSAFAPLPELRRQLEELGERVFQREVLRDRPALLFVTPDGLDSDETVATDDLFASGQAEPDPSSWFFDTAALLWTRHSAPNQVLVGRSSECDLLFALPGVSSAHARFELNGLHWTLRDASSQEGTYLNGRRLEPEVSESIRDGDRVRFGNLLSLRFCLPTTLIRVIDPGA